MESNPNKGIKKSNNRICELTLVCIDMYELFESSGAPVDKKVLSLILDLIREDVPKEAIVSLLRQIGNKKLQK
jgi:hypothetical protein